MVFNINGMEIDFNQMINRKNGVVTQMNNGVSYLMKKHKIEVFHGNGSFVNKNTVTYQHRW